MNYVNNNHQQAQRVQNSGNDVFIHDISNPSTFGTASFVHPIISDVKSSAGIGMGRIGSSNRVSLFSNSTKVTSVNSFVLVATGSNCAPAAKDSVLSFDGERVLGVQANNIRPINNDGGKWVSYSQTTISEKNCRTIQETVNQSSHEKHQSNGSTLTKVKRTAFYNDRSSHAGAKNIASTTVKISSTGAKELRITTGFSQIFEGGSRHE